MFYFLGKQTESAERNRTGKWEGGEMECALAQITTETYFIDGDQTKMRIISPLSIMARVIHALKIMIDFFFFS